MIKNEEEHGSSILSSAGTGRNCALPMRVPDPGPILDEDHALVGPEIFSGLGC